MTDLASCYASDSLHIATYDAVNDPPQPTIAGDVAFYIELARQGGGEVLECASGTGRVTFALAWAGLTVTGLDLSSGMLAVARAKHAGLPADVAARVTLVEGDMRRFDLGRRFGAVLVPFRSFQHLLTVEDQLAALAAMRRHLRPDGVLVLNLFAPRLDLLLPDQPLAAQPRERRSGIDPASGNRVNLMLERSSFDHVEQIRRDVWCYIVVDVAGAVIREEHRVLTLRWSYRWEMRHLLARAGFEILAEYSDFAKSPPAYGREQIWVAQPATPTG
ncbi:MAG TPA: class I SAM-dependent methyltransferase [Stellaceae bacterium]|nr:class I SAM-dependent methyltransferase [Stellaceae bacterium]